MGGAKRVETLLDELEPAPLPTAVAPMLCRLVAAPPEGDGWTFEPKYDGLRVLARFDGRDLTLLSRNQKAQEARFPDVAEALRAALTRPALVDGEVVCFDAEGRTSFRALQQRFHLEDPAAIAARMAAHPASIYLFDIAYIDQYDVTSLPLAGRRALLRAAVRPSDRVRLAESEAGDDGPALLRAACREGREGIVGKRLDSRYAGGRSDAWVKVKCVGRQEFVIGGWTDPQRSRVGLGALLVGVYDDEGARLRFAGKVGTGYTRETLLDLRRRLDALGRATSPFDDGDVPTGPGVHWVRPALVAEIGFDEWTQNDLLRQPRFEGLRDDKAPRACRRERPRTRLDTATDRADGPREEGAMGLDEYSKKRDFRKTAEPPARRERVGKRPIFVVQEHHASHLHYDFRLEAEGVLKSWSVPKGPSLDPKVKRLAVQVEDHPLAYATFEGDIPQGQYGGGHVAIWDHGTYEPKDLDQDVAEGLAAGRLEFNMHGAKLRGRFTLIRMKGRGGPKPQWLLMKGKDEFAEADGDAEAPKPRAKAAKPRAAQSSPAPEAFREFTHTEKLMYPDDGIIKGDVLAYYEKVAGRLLPFLRDRPATLERLPDGLAGPRFWQKNLPASTPDWVPSVTLPNERGKPVRYALVNDEATLLYLVNQGALTFHTWLSRIEDLDRPDFVLFDLDRSAAEFADVVAVAKAVHEAIGAEAVVKTSGKTGLHVLTPWTRKGGFDEARAWALEIAQGVAQSMPERATVEIRKAKRGDRVYIDVMQNARGHHAVPPYVLRAVPGAPVSTPLAWRELTAKLDPARFDLKTVPARLARQKLDPMAALGAP